MSGATITLDQPVIIDDSGQPKSIVSAYDGPLLVIAGSGGLNIQAGASTISGAIFVQGGNNTIAGGPTVANRTTANGGLQGDWLVQTGGGQNDVWLGGGNAVVSLGCTDTIHAASDHALIRGTGRGTSLDVFVGPGNVTVFGGATQADLIHADGLPTETDLLIGGSGGNNTITAGSGNTTLVGAGRNNLLQAAGTNVIHPGAGNDTVSFSIANTENLKPDDLIVGWKKSDTLELSGYDPTKQNWSQSHGWIGADPFGRHPDHLHARQLVAGGYLQQQQHLSCNSSHRPKHSITLAKSPSVRAGRIQCESAAIASQLGGGSDDKYNRKTTGCRRGPSTNPHRGCRKS